MKHHMLRRSRTAKKCVSIVDAKLDMKDITGGLSTHKNDSSERDQSESTNMDRVSDGSPGNDVSDDIQTGRTSIGTGKVDAPSGPTDERIGGTCVTNVTVDKRIINEKLKSLADLLADML